ncbi:MAG: non-ribosomal peptide synthetase, partial [bacterium]|nr:non-ribosomal peptide synthetase [bacterium]
VWQRNYLNSEIIDRQTEYWKSNLSNTPVLELPTDHPRPPEQTFNGSYIRFSLDKNLTDKLNAFSRENDVTLFMTLLSAFNILLHKYTGQDDICVGSPIANRTRSEIEPLIGFFVNTLALRSAVKDEFTFLELLDQIRKTTLSAYENQDIPFEKVVDITQPERNIAFSPLFQVMIILQNNPENALSLGELTLESIDFKHTVSKFDITFDFMETETGLVCGIEYNTDCFEAARIERMIGHFSALADA